MNVGEYARLNNTTYDTVVVLKIMEIFDNTILTENDGSIYQGEYAKEEVINHSYNIIDLIEVGDVLLYDFGGIDGICNVIEEGNILGIGWDSDGDFVNLESLDIKSIVTKEQFKNISYKVGE